MLIRIIALTLATGLLGAGIEGPQPLWQRTVARYPAPILASVGSREFKFLVAPGGFKGSPEEAFVELWTRIKEAGARQGFPLEVGWDSPFRTKRGTEEYLDTPEGALWAKGYLIRMARRASRKGVPGFRVDVTVKAVLPDAAAALALPLEVVGVEKVKAKAEDNVGMGPGGELHGYVEKAVTFSVDLDVLGKPTLGAFARFVPALGRLGLPAATPLKASRVWFVEVKPGDVDLGHGQSGAFALTCWSATEKGRPDLFDISFVCKDLDYYHDAGAQEGGERFLLKVLHGDLGSLALPGAESWGGSKVRRLLNRPLAP